MYNSPNKDNPYEESTTLVNNEARVYKGGSWLDRAYYLDPAQEDITQKQWLQTLLDLDVQCPI